MTSLTTEPAPRLRPLLVPFVCLAFAIYVFFVALAMEVYLLLIPALVLFACAGIGIAKLAPRRHPA
jgi:hypothetical protein